MKRIAYRPSFVPRHNLFKQSLDHDLPIRVDWRSHGRFGISTNDLDEALAWMAQARALKQTVTLPAPLRLVTRRGAGSTELECGHIVRSPSWHTQAVRCATCLPLDERQLWFKALKRKQK